MQKILILETYRRELNSVAFASWQDNQQLPTIPPIYQTPMHAINDGWRLLSPPFFKYTDSSQLEWWFEKYNE